MNTKHPKWRAVERIAADLRVERATILKWRQRGVPAKQVIRLIAASDGELSISDFVDNNEGVS